MQDQGTYQRNYNKARKRAWLRLQRLHNDDYQRLLTEECASLGMTRKPRPRKDPT